MKMRKFVAGIYAAVICIQCACAVSPKGQTEEPKETANNITSIREAAQKSGFQLITADTASFSAFEQVSPETCLLFEAAAFEDIMGNSEQIREAIYAGGNLAVFDRTGIRQDFEEQMQLPIVLQDPQPGYIAIGRMYSTADGLPCVTQVEVPLSYDDTQRYTFYEECLRDFRTNSDMKSQLAGSSLEKLGEAQYFVSGGSGEIRARYEIFTVQDYAGEDIYNIHAYITPTVTSGRILESLVTEVTAYEPTAFIFNDYPISTDQEGTDEFSVSLELSPANLALNMGWKCTVPKIFIAKRSTGTNSVKWTVTPSPVAEIKDDLKFEPGMSISVDVNTTQFTVIVDNTLQATGLTTAATSGNHFFICYPDRVQDSLN